MSDLAIVDPSAALDAAADPGEFVMVALERGKSWLTEALAHGDLEALVNMKGWAATLRTATMQKQLGKDAELAATELVRRAERCIGLGIRRGQAAGDIAEQGQRVDLPGTPDVVISDICSKAEWTGNGEGVAHLTDDVTDEQFEQAIETARDESNLSRANVVRHAKPDKPSRDRTGRHDIHRGLRRINPARIIEESIASLEAIAAGLSLIDDVKSLDAEKRPEWLSAIRQPLDAITRFTKELRG